MEAPTHIEATEVVIILVHTSADAMLGIARHILATERTATTERKIRTCFGQEAKVVIHLVGIAETNRHLKVVKMINGVVSHNWSTAVDKRILAGTTTLAAVEHRTTKVGIGDEVLGVIEYCSTYIPTGMCSFEPLKTACALAVVIAAMTITATDDKSFFI